MFRFFFYHTLDKVMCPHLAQVGNDLWNADLASHQCLDAGQKVFKAVHLFNEKLVHLVDERFWYTSFRSTELSNNQIISHNQK
jgi:hypothetical protein